MAKPNYSFAKRQRELAKKKKKEEKRQRKAAEQEQGKEHGQEPTDMPEGDAAPAVGSSDPEATGNPSE